MGAADDVEYVVRRLREAWPGVRIHVQGDSGFGVPSMYDVCERLDIEYTFGMGMNARLKKLSDLLLTEAVARRDATGQSQRLFTAFWYRPIPGQPSVGSLSIAKPMPRNQPAGGRANRRVPSSCPARPRQIRRPWRK